MAGPTPSSPVEHDDAAWQPRTIDVSASINRYSKFVGWMRIALPIAAALLLLIVFVVPQFRGEDERFRIADAPVPEAAVDTLSMVNARYFGTDAKGQPFSVTAKSVRERSSGDRRVELTSPQADITLSNGMWLSVDAAAGLYDSDREILDLSGEVNLYQDQGYEIHTASAIVDLNDGAASGTSAVDTQGPFGQMTSAGFELFEKGDVVVFTGPAHLILRGSSPESAAIEKSAP